jgi:hypothetical protein
MTADDLIATLSLEPHPLEGGYYRRTFQSRRCVGEAGERRLMSSIYYMLTRHSPVGYLHQNTSDIVHYYHLGAPMKYLTVSPAGEVAEHWLGVDLAAGQRPQLLVPGGYWKASALVGGDYSLISEAVVPGFDYRDNALAGEFTVRQLFPALLDDLRSYIRPGTA